MGPEDEEAAMKTLGMILTGFISLGVLGCEPSAYRIASEPHMTARATPAHRPAHCRDLPTDVPCTRADTGK
jgi:hypothetical protein